MGKITSAIIQKSLIAGIQKTEQIFEFDYAMDCALNQLQKILISQRTNKWNWTKSNEKVFINLVKYFNNQDSKLDNNKGFVLCGPNGTGKTTLLKAFSLFSIGMNNKRYKVIHSQNIVDELSKYQNGFCLTGYYDRNEKYSTAIDEIGKESISNIFGNKIDPLEQVICMRYQNGLRTFGTTNLNIEQIKSRYGERLYSRFKEMFNIIKLEGSDKRIKTEI